jgi:hypothetical protein
VKKFNKTSIITKSNPDYTQQSFSKYLAKLSMKMNKGKQKENACHDEYKRIKMFCTAKKKKKLYYFLSKNHYTKLLKTSKKIIIRKSEHRFN